MGRPHEERVVANVAINGGDGTSPAMGNYGVINYVEVQHPAPGDPAYKLQIVNLRGTVVWESPATSGDAVIWVDEDVPTYNHKCRILAGSIAGDYICFVNFS